MNKKIFSIFIAVFLLLGGLPLVYAEAPTSQNINDIYGGGGSTGITPPTDVVRVRYAMRGNSVAGLSSGDVVVWDLNSADGVTISRCTVSAAMSYAGVLVTDIATADTSSLIGGSRNWGYMAVHGFALAKVDTSVAASGEQLVPNGSDTAQYGSFGTKASLNAASTVISADIGVLLSDTATDGLMPVWLY
ncbi:MAG: hypothetical protein ABFC84_16695 [Veillonellales bacterium]